MISHGTTSLYVSLVVTCGYIVTSLISKKNIPDLKDILIFMIATIGVFSAINIALHMMENHEKHNLDSEQLIIVVFGAMSVAYVSFTEITKAFTNIFKGENK